MFCEPLILPVACVIIWGAGLAPAEDFDFQSLSDVDLFQHVGRAGKHIEQMFWSEKATDNQTPKMRAQTQARSIQQGFSYLNGKGWKHPWGNLSNNYIIFKGKKKK